MLEHLTFAEQPQALAELFRVVAPGGELLVTVPNLAHLQSRVHFAAPRPADSHREPGQASGRSAGRRVSSIWRARAGFRLVERRGIFPTVPVLTRWIRATPARLRWLHRLLTRLLPVPGWCFLNVLRFERP